MLYWLVFLPIIGSLICWLLVVLTQKMIVRLNQNPDQAELKPSLFQKIKISLILYGTTWCALLTMVTSLAIAVSLWMDSLAAFYRGETWRIEVNLDWISLLNIRFHLLLDGLSILMIVLSIFIVILAILYSRKEKHSNIGLYYFCLLCMATGVIGLFTAIDLFLFILFWEAIAIPLYFIIVLWGRRDSSAQLRFNGASRFLIFTQISSLLMLISIIVLALINWHYSHTWTFDYNVLIKTPISSYTEFILMLGFFAGLAVRIPLIPFHGWFISAHVESSVSGSMMISGLLTNTAIYSLLRFVIPIFPNASFAFAPIAIGFGVFTLFYAALLAFNQNDIKRLIAYIHIAMMGLLTTAIYISSLLTYKGLIIVMLAISLSIVGLFAIGGLLTERYMTRNIKQFVGLRGEVWYLPAFTLFFSLATLGVPGTANFVGNFMILFGSFPESPVVTILLLTGLLFVAIALFVRMQPIFYKLTDDIQLPSKVSTVYKALTITDIIWLLSLSTILVAIGIYPQPILDTVDSVISLIQQYLAGAGKALVKGGV